MVISRSVIEWNSWYDEYFQDTQGEDSPYGYRDVKAAFKAGFKSGREARK